VQLEAALHGRVGALIGAHQALAQWQVVYPAAMATDYFFISRRLVRLLLIPFLGL
jgi:hypothetical protein